MSRSFYSLIFFFAFLLHGCKKKECEQTIQEPITEASGPKSGFINQDNVFIVTATGMNLCAQSVGLVSEQFENTVIVKANVHYIGCMCLMSLTSLSTPFTFRTSSPGTYMLKFLQQDGGYITDTLVIQ